MITEEISNEWGKVNLDDDAEWDDEEGFVVEDEEAVVPDSQQGLYVLAKVIANKPINSKSFIKVMKGV